MLHDAYRKGVKEAYARYGIKEAALQPGAVARFGQGALDAIKSIPRLMIGHPEKVLQQGRGAFRPGGILDPKSILWPSVERGVNGERLPQIMGWLGRASTLSTGYNAYKAMKGEAGDPNEGRLSNTLGAVGGSLGMGFGLPAAGALGAPVLARAGQALGKGIGHAFGSSPEPQQLDPLMYGQGVYQ